MALYKRLVSRAWAVPKRKLDVLLRDPLLERFGTSIRAVNQNAIGEMT